MKCELFGIVTAVRSRYCIGGIWANSADIEFPISEGIGIVCSKDVPLGNESKCSAASIGLGSKFKITIETIE